MFTTIIIIYDSLIHESCCYFWLSIRRITVILYGDSCKSVCARAWALQCTRSNDLILVNTYIFVFRIVCQLWVYVLCSVLTLECDRSHYKLLISECFFFLLLSVENIRIAIVPVSLKCMRAMWVVVVCCWLSSRIYRCLYNFRYLVLARLLR